MLTACQGPAPKQGGSQLQVCTHGARREFMRKLADMLELLRWLPAGRPWLLLQHAPPLCQPLPLAPHRQPLPRRRCLCSIEQRGVQGAQAQRQGSGRGRQPGQGLRRSLLLCPRFLPLLLGLFICAALLSCRRSHRCCRICAGGGFAGSRRPRRRRRLRELCQGLSIRHLVRCSRAGESVRVRRRWGDWQGWGLGRGARLWA